MRFDCINESEVKRVINNLHSKSSYGYDGISTILLKKLEPLINEPLTLIINQSLNSGIFPEKLKISKITPIYKKNELHCIENYKPISLLPAISKVVEKISYDQLYSYFSSNKYLHENQYGFRKNHSTEYSILEIIDRIALDLDKGNMPLAIYLDLSKAFDTLNHGILIDKLQYYGVSHNALNWFRTYLQNRLYYVEIENHKSDFTPIGLGVPQGSILGPLLFIIYTNDIQCCSDFFKFIEYADDTTLFNSNVDINNENSLNINKELQNVYEWLCANKLSN